MVGRGQSSLPGATVASLLSSNLWNPSISTLCSSSACNQPNCSHTSRPSTEGFVVRHQWFRPSGHHCKL